MSKLFTSYFDDLSKFIFDFYDMDNDGEISKEDVKLILSSLPIKKQKYSFSYKFLLEEISFTEQIVIQEEIVKIIKDMFKKETMKFDTFKLYITKISIDPFIYPLLCLYDLTPFSKDTILYYSTITPLKNNLSKIGNNSNNDSIISSNSNKLSQSSNLSILNQKGTITPFPNLYSKFESSITLLKNEYLRQFLKDDDLKQLDNVLGPKKMNIPFNIQLKKNIVENLRDSISKDELGDKKLKRNSIVNVSEDYILDNIDINDTEIFNNKIARPSFFKSFVNFTFEGLMYKMTKLKKLKLLYVKIFGNDI